MRVVVHVNANPNTEPVVYSQVDAAALANTFDSTASKLREYKGSIRAEANKAQEQFNGKYAELFKINCDQCITDAGRLADACSRAAQAVRKIAEAADHEQDNRRKAREAEEEHRRKMRDEALKYAISSNGLDTLSRISYQDGALHIQGEGPSYVASQEPTIVVNPNGMDHDLSNSYGSSRPSDSEKYAESLGSSTGVSSAVPVALEQFADFVMGPLYDDMTFYFKSISTAYERYQQTCHWGTLLIDGLLEATVHWLNDNSHDAMWLKAVAQAFRVAGSNGQFVITDAALTEFLKRNSINPGRKFLKVPDVQVYGTTPTSGYASDPVNVATGNFIEEEHDLTFGSLQLSRMYNSIAATGSASSFEGYEPPTGVFGVGWSSTIDTHLKVTNAGAIWVSADGRQLFFSRMGTGFERAAGEPWWLARCASGPHSASAHNTDDEDAQRTRAFRVGYRAIAELVASVPPTDGYSALDGSTDFYVVSNNAGAFHYYTLTGAWIGSWYGNAQSTVAALYTSSGQGCENENRSSARLCAIAGAGGQCISLSYDSNKDVGRVVTASAGTRRIEYTYTESGHLASARTYSTLKSSTNNTEPLEVLDSRVYTHTEQGLIETVTGSGDVREVTNIYEDPEYPGRVTQQIGQHGCIIDYTYLPGGITQVVVKDSEKGHDAPATAEETTVHSQTSHDGEEKRIGYADTWVSDEKGRLTSVTSAEGLRSGFIYDMYGNRIQSISPDGARIVRSADERGRIIKELTPAGTLTTFTYDALDRLCSVRVYASRMACANKQPAQESINYEYVDDFSRLHSAVTRNGATTRYEYTPSGKVARVTDPTGVFTSFAYDERDNLVQTSNAIGDTITMSYDTNDRVVAVRMPSGATTYAEYDDASRPVLLTDPTGATTRYTYTQAGKISTVTDPTGAIYGFEYNETGDVAAVIAPDGARTTSEFDEIGYLNRIVDPSGAVTRILRDGMGRVTELIDPAGSVWCTDYDAADTLVEHIDPTGVWERTTRDIAKGLYKTQNANGTERTTLDSLGRIRELVDLSGGLTRWSYENLATGVTSGAHQSVSPSVSNLPSISHTQQDIKSHPGAHTVVTRTDAADGEHREVYDAAGRVIQQISATGAVTAYTYDACGRVSTVTDPDGYTTEHTYDADSRLVAKTCAGTVVESFSYDPAGRVLEHRRGGQLIGRYSYDAAGRPVLVVDSAWGTRRFSYDACGRVTKTISGTGGVCFFDYDAASRLVAQRVATADGFATTTYSYDAAGNMVSTTDPAGATTSYEYDAAHRCTAVTHADSSRVLYAYDEAGELASTSVVPPGGAPQLACEWVQDVQRRKLVVRDWLAAANLPKTGAGAGGDSAQPFVETTYVSDALGRLERVERAQLLGGVGSACGYGDDPVSDFAAAGAYTVRYAYDADSRLVEQVTPYEHTTLAYTPAGRLSQARSGPDDMTVRQQEPTRFAYDALGYLESTQLDETVARWVRDAAGAVVEYTEQGTYGPERGVRVERNELGKITRVEDTVAGIACTYSYDAAGRLIRAVNSTGYAVDWVYDHAGLLLREESCEGESLVRLRVFTYADGGRVQSMRVYEKALAVQGEAASAGVVDADSAGEAPEGMVRVAAIEYTYDERGFRTQATGCGGSVTRWDWDVLGSLERVHTYSGDHESSGVLTSDVQFVNSAERGMPVAVSSGSLGSGEAGNYSPMLWGPAAGNAPQLLGVGAVQTPASSTVIGGRDTPLGTENLGYGLQRASGPVSESAGFGVDVWGIPAPISWGVSSDNQGFALGQAGLPVGVGLSAHGSLVTAGGELMGDRVYDPATAGFLAPDPLDSVMGSGWMGAPYVFAGGDPVNMFDPTGRRPLTIDEARQLHDAYYTPSLEEKWDSFRKDFKQFVINKAMIEGKFLADFTRDPWGWITSYPSEMAALGLGLVAVALIVVGVITLNPFIASMGAFMLVSMTWSYASQIWHKGKADPNEIIQEGLYSALIDLVTLGVGKGLKFVLKPLLSRFGIRWGAHELHVPGGMSSSGRARPGVVPGRSVVVKYPQLYRKGAVSSGGRSAEEALYEGRYGRQVFDASNLDFRGSGFAASGVVVPESGAHVPLRPSAGGRSATEVPPVAVSGVDGSRVGPVQGSGVSRGGSQVPLRPVEAARVGEVPPAQVSAAKGTENLRTVPDEVRPPAGSARESNVTLDAVEDPKVYRDGEISSTNKGTGTSEAQVKPENPQSEITPETGGTTKGREDTPLEISSGDHHTPKPEEPTEPEKPSPRGKREEVTTATEADAKNHVYYESGINNVREVTDLAQVRQELHDLPDGYGKTTGYFRYKAEPTKGDAPDGGGLEMKAPDPKDVFDEETGEWTGRKVGRTKSQNDDLEAYVEYLKEKGAKDFLVDQQQVDFKGNKVGINRPDLQFTLGDKRYYVEWDRTTSGREIGHAERIAANDPAHGGIELRIVDPYKK